MIFLLDFCNYFMRKSYVKYSLLTINIEVLGFAYLLITPQVQNDATCFFFSYHLKNKEEFCIQMYFSFLFIFHAKSAATNNHRNESSDILN